MFSDGANDLAVALGYLMVVNVVGYAAFVADKRAARRGTRRIAERTLLLLALVGGTPAAYVARHLLRHKTRKQPFVAKLHAIATLQVLVVIAGIVLAMMSA
jgi:uncharacterized membrane protein YsdA (DUF1294 family)